MPQHSSASSWGRLAASSLYTVGSSLATAGCSIVTGIGTAAQAGIEHLTTDASGKEVVLHARFAQLELPAQNPDQGKWASLRSFSAGHDSCAGLSLGIAQPRCNAIWFTLRL